MTIAYLGLGSNLGNRLAFLRGGRDALAAHPDITLRKQSGVYETAAEGGPPDNPPFLNTVVEIETSLEPRGLLEACMAVEDEFGRTRPAEWAPRTLDVDLLLVDDRVVSEPDLVIPHPRLHLRSFVLAPLSEIAPGAIHPKLMKRVAELAALNPDVARLEKLRPNW